MSRTVFQLPVNYLFVFFVYLLLLSIPFISVAGQGKGLKTVEPPTPLVAATYDEGIYKIHIFQNGDVKAVKPENRSVLILGTFSNSSAVIDSRNYINPSTGKRFDVIIGLGSDSLGAELRRVVLTDHFTADQNAAALKAALAEHFGGPLEAGTLYTHSNGTTVGVAATLDGTFTGVRQMNMMGPDIGYGGTYLSRESLVKLKSMGVEGVSIFRNRGDIVPTLGYLTKALGDAIPGVSLANQTVKSLKAIQDLVSAPRDIGLPQINAYEIKNGFGDPLSNHFAENYLNSIAGFINDGGLTKVPVSDPLDAKGVRIYIDDEILIEALVTGSPAENQQIFADLAKRLDGASGDGQTEGMLSSFADLLKERFKQSKRSISLDKVILVSLRQLLKGATPFVDKWNELPENLQHPGPITRINGYIFSPDHSDIFLIGSANAGEVPIEIDDLIVGLRAAWRDDQVPFCSLDPDAENVAGPQKVRVSGVPGDSGFALTMLDADYSMKKIMFGIDRVDAEGYRSNADILRADPDPKMGANRFWLYPVQPRAGEIQVSPDMSSALFAAGVQVLSEQMVQTSEGFSGTGTVDPDADLAAAIFTQYYAKIAGPRPEFQRLQGLFDIVMAARILRQSNIRSDVLDQFVALPYKPVAVPLSYDGLTVELNSSDARKFRLSGGVQAKTNAGKRAMLGLDEPGVMKIRDLTRENWQGNSPARSLTNISLEIIPPDPKERDTANLTLSSAMNRLGTGDFHGALAFLDKSISADPSDPEPLAYRAYVSFISGDVASARSDALAAQRMDPNNSTVVDVTSTVLFQCDLLDGKPDSALRQIDWAIRNDPSSVRSHTLRATALIEIGQPAEARKELIKATQMDPTSALALAKLGLLEISEGWLTKGRKLIEKASIMAEALHQKGPEVRVTLAFAEMAAAAGGNVKTQLAKAETIANDVLADPACDPRSAIQALIVLTGISLINEDWDKADGYIVRANKYAPAAPDLLLYAAEAAFESKRPDLAEKYLSAAERVSPGNPAVKALRQKIGR